MERQQRNPPPRSKPKRIRSAYNFFFQSEMKVVQRMLREQTGGQGTYEQMTRLVAKRWTSLNTDEKLIYKNLAANDKRRFALEFLAWKMNQEEEAREVETENSAKQPESDVPPLSFVFASTVATPNIKSNWPLLSCITANTPVLSPTCGIARTQRETTPICTPDLDSLSLVGETSLEESDAILMDHFRKDLSTLDQADDLTTIFD